MLDNIQLMGWTFEPVHVFVNEESIELDQFIRYDKENQILFLSYPFTMNDDYEVVFNQF